jgi:hypothetical protein
MLLCVCGKLGFGHVVDAGIIRRGFGRGFGTAGVIVAVAGWPRSWIFRVRLWAGFVDGKSGEGVCLLKRESLGVWGVAAAADI